MPVKPGGCALGGHIAVARQGEDGLRDMRLVLLIVIAIMAS